MKDIHKNMDIVQNDDRTINEQNYMISFTYLLGVKLVKIDYKVGGELKKEIIIDDEGGKELFLRLRNPRNNNNLAEVNVKPDFVIHRYLSRDGMNDEMISLARQKKYQEAIESFKQEKKNFDDQWHEMDKILNQDMYN